MAQLKNTTINGTLNVSGAATLASVTSSGDVTVEGKLTVNSDISLETTTSGPRVILTNGQLTVTDIEGVQHIEGYRTSDSNDAGLLKIGAPGGLLLYSGDKYTLTGLNLDDNDENITLFADTGVDIYIGGQNKNSLDACNKIAISNKGCISREYQGCSYIDSRDNSLIALTSEYSGNTSSYAPILSCKVYDGYISQGVIFSNTDANNKLSYMEWIYTADIDYDNTDNTSTSLMSLTKDGKLTASSFNATSDARLKENFQPLNIEKSILDLPTYKFDFINGSKNPLQRILALIHVCHKNLLKHSHGRPVTIFHTNLSLK